MSVDIDKIIKEKNPKLPELSVRGLKEGTNTVHKEPDGRKLVAHVNQGVIAQWTAVDKDGSSVPSVVIQKPPKSLDQEKAELAARARYFIVCACFESGDLCWWVIIVD
jgi:hypothetical protein